MREKERNISVERNIDSLPLACAPTVDQTHNLLVYKSTFQLTEPHWPGREIFCNTTLFTIFFVLENTVLKLKFLFMLPFNGSIILVLIT